MNTSSKTSTHTQSAPATDVFQFGKNWQRYVAEHFSSEALDRSIESMRTFLGGDLTGKSFLDAGCGSGIHSLAALRLGARDVTSFDADKDSVHAANSLKEHVAPHSAWKIQAGSLLDQEYLRGLGQFDVVYCWGVAHHTGNMWQALENLHQLVAPGGRLYLAIYNTVPGRLGSTWWHRVKRFYVHSPRIVQKIMEWGFIAYHLVHLIIRFKNPFTVMRDYKKKRGMDLTTDLIDWLGGYPYEYAKSEEIFLYYKNKFDLELLNLKTTTQIGCNQFLFLKR